MKLRHTEARSLRVPVLCTCGLQLPLIEWVLPTTHGGLNQHFWRMHARTHARTQRLLTQIPAEHHRAPRMGLCASMGPSYARGLPRTTRSTRSATQKAYFGACLRACPERHRQVPRGRGSSFLNSFHSSRLMRGFSHLSLAAKPSLITNPRERDGRWIAVGSSRSRHLADWDGESLDATRLAGMLPCFQSPVVPYR